MRIAESCLLVICCAGVEQPELPAECFEFTVTAGLLAVTGCWVFAQQKFRQQVAIPCDLVGFGLDRHPIRTFAHARSCQHALADINNTHSADTHGRHTFRVAKHRNINAGMFGSFPDR